MFHNIAPLEFVDFIPYFVSLVPSKFTVLLHCKLYEILSFPQKPRINFEFSIFFDLNNSVAKKWKCF